MATKWIYFLYCEVWKSWFWHSSSPSNPFTHCNWLSSPKWLTSSFHFVSNPWVKWQDFASSQWTLMPASHKCKYNCLQLSPVPCPLYLCIQHLTAAKNCSPSFLELEYVPELSSLQDICVVLEEYWMYECQSRGLFVASTIPCQRKYDRAIIGCKQKPEFVLRWIHFKIGYTFHDACNVFMLLCVFLLTRGLTQKYIWTCAGFVFHANLGQM